MTPDGDEYSESGPACGNILGNVVYIDYGIWSVSPGKSNGDCSVTFTDTITNAQAIMTVINQANANAFVGPRKTNTRLRRVSP